jgi:16S rRNA (adenine1518-N6/adenine1519-N6)-dimethyltransferase
VLVELDDELARRLAAEFADDPAVHVVHADILDVELDERSSEVPALKVIGNIPYNITTPILFSLLERRPRPRSIVLMVQREVAERIVAPPGSKTYGALAVGVQSVARAERVLNVGRNAFRPVPDVESTVVRITPFAPAASSRSSSRPPVLTRAAFGQRRKQFQRILRDAYDLTPDQIAALEESTGFDLRHRPETFSPEDFVRLAAELDSLTRDG